MCFMDSTFFWCVQHFLYPPPLNHTHQNLHTIVVIKQKGPPYVGKGKIKERKKVGRERCEPSFPSFWYPLSLWLLEGFS